MGLHTGEPVSTPEGYVGVDVHRAARICAAGHGGQILLSQTTRDLIERGLPADTGLRDLGAHRLKDLQQPEQLFQLLHPDLLAEFPPLKSLDALPNNLPSQPTSFIGREKEMAEIRQVVKDARLLTLTGPGGSGKTRLALQAAAELLDEFADGVWLVELASLADPAVVPQAVASVLDIREQPGRALMTTLVDALQSRRTLLILDNCEHVLASCVTLTDALLRGCPRLHILATSREALGITGEIAFQVPSLALPDIRGLPPLDRLNEYEAVRLFIDRATAVRRDFRMTDGNAPAVAKLCHRLDGIPLAIELAAARVKVLSPEQIADRLDDRFRLLTGGSRAALPRHQTLQAAMDWSYDLLSEKERMLLQRLSVFAGGFTLEAGEAICSRDGLGEGEMLDVLTHLVDKSLVLAEGQNGEIRYRLLETVRQYAWDRLLESGESPMLRGRHLDWYLALAEHASREWSGPSEGAWVDRLEREHDNLRVALDWALGSDDAEPGFRLGGALRWFWAMRGYLTEGRERLEASLSRSDASPTASRANALMACGWLVYLQGDYAIARPLLEEALEINRRLGDKRGIAHSLNRLANLMARSQGDMSAARSSFHESLAICRELGIKPFIGTVLNDLGMMLIPIDPVEARGFLEESLAVMRESGWKGGIAVPLVLLARLASMQGNDAQARMLAEESLAMSREAGRRSLVPDLLALLGHVAAAEGDTIRPRRSLKRAWPSSAKWAVSRVPGVR